MAEVKEKIVITPAKEIQFKSNTVSDDNVSKLTLQNLSTSRCIAFKIKTTAPKNYVVKPNQGIIDCESTVTVDVTFCPSEVSDFVCYPL
jgi:hypothetical protein